MSGRPRLYPDRAAQARAYRARKKARSFVTDRGEFRPVKRGTKCVTKPGRPRLYPTVAARKKAYRRRLALKVYHKSQCATWETPPEVFGPLAAEFGFTLDVCAVPETAKCPRYFTPAEDGLAQVWEGVCWMNPPYGRGVEQWIRKAYESSLTGATVVCLVKATPDTRWWHTYTPHAEVRWVPGRVRFVGAPGPAPFPVCVVIFRPPGGAYA
jgi:phage N-6-adenine-methyltransferase